jgi:hypothetical protein
MAGVPNPTSRRSMKLKTPASRRAQSLRSRRDARCGWVLSDQKGGEGGLVKAEGGSQLRRARILVVGDGCSIATGTAR